MKAWTWSLGVLGAFLLSPGSPYSTPLHPQDTAGNTFVELPELLGFKLSNDQYLVFNCRIDGTHKGFITSLRRIPSVSTTKVPTTLLIDRHLSRASKAFQDDFCYLESDWLTTQELEKLAAIIRRVALTTRELFPTSNRLPVKEVLFRKKEDYLAMIDAWSDQELVKKQGRSFASTIINEIRCGYRTSFPDLLPLIVGDAVNLNVSTPFRSQEALLEGLHTYFASLICQRYEAYVSLSATTPGLRRSSNVILLCETAKEYLSRPAREPLEQILSYELNSLNLERLSVSFALIQFLLEKRMDQWKAFCQILESESLENGTLKGPEGRRAALAKAVHDGLGITFKGLDKQLQDFTSKDYLFPEEIAVALGLDRETPDSIFQGFVQVCELKRAKKPVTPKGETLYDQMMKKMDKVIQERGEKW